MNIGTKTHAMIILKCLHLIMAPTTAAALHRICGAMIAGSVLLVVGRSEAIQTFASNPTRSCSCGYVFKNPVQMLAGRALSPVARPLQ